MSARTGGRVAKQKADSRGLGGGGGGCKLAKMCGHATVNISKRHIQLHESSTPSFTEGQCADNSDCSLVLAWWPKCILLTHFLLCKIKLEK